MISLSTPVTLPAAQDVVEYGVPVLMLGSCFTENIGRSLADAFFDVDINPFGETYNPMSLCRILQRIESGVPFVEKELTEYGGLWHSMMHHGSFSAPTAEETLFNINSRLARAGEILSRKPVLILTLGTAYVYETADGVVNNCHKMPAGQFSRRRVSVGSITDAVCKALEKTDYSHLILTVSPIRHLRDGAHDNQLSKATLLLAAEQIAASAHDVTYFPAYEIVLDELRDYRFYADDLVHPSAVAEEYVFERFARTFMSQATIERMEQCRRVRQRLNHRFLHPGSAEAREFEAETKRMMERLGIKQQEN